MTTGFIVDHLWQSSCFALFAGVLAFALRKNSPTVRYWVWLSASLKFLAPFALLVSLGTVVPQPSRKAAVVPDSGFPNTLVEIAEPFTSARYAPVAAHDSVDWRPIAMGIIWAIGFLAIVSARFRGWLKVQATLRASSSVKLPIAIPAFTAPGAIEPGIVGFVQPALVLPAQLLDLLNPRQLGAILSHELHHVRRRDNLFAAVHMAVEALFWFNPLVWWIGSHMLEERESACDEEVLRTGFEPAEYVEGMLKVCRLCTESPLPCVSGVSGAHVQKRLRTILTGKIAPDLSLSSKLLLSLAAATTIVTPIAVGVLNAPTVNAQALPSARSTAPRRPLFEVASIRRCTEADLTTYRNSLSAGDGRGGGGGAPSPGDPGLMRSVCVPLTNLIVQAYFAFADGKSFKPGYSGGGPSVREGPAWINDRYTINARPETRQNMAMMAGPMMQALLEDRFRLRIHRASERIPAYALVIGKGGPKLGLAKDCPIDGPPNLAQTRCYYQEFTATGTNASGWRMTNLALLLGAHLNRMVIDKTGIAGAFDFHLDLPEPPPPNSPGIDDPNNPDLLGSVMDAVQKLGLKLEPVKGTAEFLVIDHIERPTEN